MWGAANVLLFDLTDGFIGLSVKIHRAAHLGEVHFSECINVPLKSKMNFSMRFKGFPNMFLFLVRSRLEKLGIYDSIYSCNHQ